MLGTCQSLGTWCCPILLNAACNFLNFMLSVINDLFGSRLDAMLPVQFKGIYELLLMMTRNPGTSVRAGCEPLRPCHWLLNLLLSITQVIIVRYLLFDLSLLEMAFSA